ncbi:GNAT family N-acetyltransferase [Flavobacteriaceae bacterium KMM 6897]|nr:GNAT family N-acetyltransferase [Flavobacteriaceae bacterium KMM 6897]MEB8347027.1 GNAT family N-acetyltransferase [Flavobacteriaceae bacterium KMM 6898]
MMIRKATANDAESIAPILMLVLEKMVYKFIGETDFIKAKEFLTHFLKRKNNQYSYQNCFVAESGNEIIGVVNLYNGADLNRLRQPVLEHIHHYYSTDLHIADETQAGEYYIDTISVRSSEQGKGIGSRMLHQLIEEFTVKEKQTLGLLVDVNNPKAKKLYLKMGFECVGTKVLLGHNLDHLQFKSKGHILV